MPIRPIRLIKPISPILIGLFLGLVLFLAFITASEVADFLVRRSFGVGGSPRFQFLINEEKFNQFIETHFSSYETPAKDAGLKILKIDDDYIIHLIPSQEGLEVNKTLLKLELKEYLRNPTSPRVLQGRGKVGKNSLSTSNQPIDQHHISVYLTKSYPQIRDSEVANARMKAYQILATPVNLVYEDPSTSSGQDQTWKVPQEEVAEWIEFVPKDESYLLRTLKVTLNTQAIKTFITPFVSEINKEPVNAELEMKNGKVVAFALSQEGRRLDLEESTKKIASLIPEASRDLVSGSSGTIELAVNTLTPQVTTESIENLGITTLIGKGESNFAGSPNNRIHNIKLSSAKLNGILIKPGEEFSFNETLGEVGPTEGYLPELIIKKDKVTPEFGGGVCQASTTMFRAALFSGLPIIERFPHTFPVVYYYPQGMDATVYNPHPDLRFKNDTPGHILIQRKIIGTKLIFEFYGTDEITTITSEVKRTVKIKGPYTIEKKEDGSIKTILYREIYYDGELVKEEIFRSSYASPEKYPRE